MNIDIKPFGILSKGENACLYILTAGELALSLTDYGAAWTSLIVPSKNGKKDDVLLGYSGLKGYLNDKFFMGATIGRFANRIGGASFSLNGASFALDANDGKNTLHGGFRGFDKRLWKAKPYTEGNGVFVRFELESPDGDCGFPGNLKAQVTYGLTKSNEIIAIYEAISCAPTPVNLTNHAYFNLRGEGSGDVLSHELRLHSGAYLEVGQTLLPTGKLIPVRDTAFDFKTSMPMGRGAGIEYDHCFTLDGDVGTLRPCAEVFESGSGRTMKVQTTQPGVQFYTGNMLTRTAGKQGSVYTKHSGFCLETQHFPDSPNQSGFPSCILYPGKIYHEKTIFAFDW